jgi:ABC-type transporter Mla MlaB component
MSEVSHLPANAAQVQQIDTKARELLAQWVHHMNLRKVAAEIVFASPLAIVDPVKTSRELYAFLSETT